MTATPKLRVGINGFGRIGRAIARINLEKQAFDLVAINDVNPDIENLAYLRSTTPSTAASNPLFPSMAMTSCSMACGR